MIFINGIIIHSKENMLANQQTFIDSVACYIIINAICMDYNRIHHL